MLLSFSKSTTAFWLGLSEWALLLFGIVLVVGLVGEHRGLKSAEWKAREHIFSMLVVIGVAGELLADAGIFLFGGHLQTISDRESAQLNLRASSNELARVGLQQQVANTESNNLVLRSNVAALELQIAQISTNVSNMDPITGPVRTAEAHVLLVLSKPVVAKNRNEGMICAWLRIWDPVSQSTNGFISIDFSTEQFTEHTDDIKGEQKFSMDFHFRPDERPFGGEVFPPDSRVSAVETINALDGFDLTIWFLPPHAEIVRGFIALKVNSSLQRIFPIPPQNIGWWGEVVSPISLKPKWPEDWPKPTP